MDIYPILASKQHNPHYLNRYITFIEKCQLKNIDYEGYTEKHHICPKARDMFPQHKYFKENSWNQVKLTAREHFIAHWILWKTYPGTMSQKEAFWLMSNKNNIRKSKTYELIKIEKSKITSLRHKNKNVSQYTREKISLSKRGKTFEEIMGIELATSAKTKMSEARKGKYKGDNNPMYGKTGEMHHNYGKSINAGSTNYMYGKTHTEETKSKISAFRKNKARLMDDIIINMDYDRKLKILNFYLKFNNLKNTSANFSLPQSKILQIIKELGYYPSGKLISEFRISK